MAPGMNVGWWLVVELDGYISDMLLADVSDQACDVQRPSGRLVADVMRRSGC